MKFILLIIIYLTLLNCSSKNCIYISSPNKKQYITVISENNCRYIINGKHRNVPKTNYVKVDLSQVDKIGDGLAGCWENSSYKWLIINDQAIILENK